MVMNASPREYRPMPALEQYRAHLELFLVAKTSTVGVPHLLHRRLNTSRSRDHTCGMNVCLLRESARYQ